VILQAICDANWIFLDVVYKWPGSCHDSFYTNAIYEQFENYEQLYYGQFEIGRYGNGILLHLNLRKCSGMLINQHFPLKIATRSSKIC